MNTNHPFLNVLPRIASPALLLTLSGCNSDQHLRGDVRDLFGGNASGLIPVPVTDTFGFVPPKVDLVLFLDSSCSMGSEQDKLEVIAWDFTHILFGEVNDKPWADIGVHITTVDCDNPTLTEVDGVQPCGQVTSFFSEDYRTSEGWDGDRMMSGVSEAIQVGSEGSNTENTLGAIEHALGAVNEGTLRPDSALHMLMLTDDDNILYSAAEMDNLTALLSREASTRPALTISGIFGIVEPEEATCSAQFAPQLLELTGEFPGFAFDICSADWFPAAERLSVGVLDGVAAFGLSHLANPETISVEVHHGAVVQVPEFSYYPSPGNYVVVDSAATEEPGTAEISYLPLSTADH